MGAMGKVGFKVIGVAFAVPSGIAARKLLDKAWVRSRGDKPPASSDRKSPDSDWLEILAWSVVSAGVTAAVQVAATHAAAGTYRALTGQRAPSPQADADRKATKKALKTAAKQAKKS